VKNELVETRKGKVWSNSLIFAKVFDIAHIHVLEKIRTLTIENPTVKNMFILTEYENERKRKYPMYYFDRDGYMFLVMNVANKKANEIKLRFIQAFNMMEQGLVNKQNTTWNAIRDEGKQVRLELTDTVKEFVEYAKSQGSTQADRYYTHYTKMTYKALELIDSNKSTPIRDMLSQMQLSFLMVAENTAQKALKEGMEQGLNYHDIYTYAKEKVVEFSSLINPNLIKSMITASTLWIKE